MATREKTDYLRFNAFAIKDLINRKLAQDSTMTDQVYPGSNVTILIDILSYMYQTLLFCLNNSAAESMWADTQIYENINRLCSFIGYHPHGMNPSCAVFTFSVSDLLNYLKENNYISEDANLTNTDFLVLPRYSYIDSGASDSAGNEIYFSTVHDIEISNNKENVEIVLYNGRWKMYDAVFVSNGSDWEKFVLDGLRSDASTGDYVANNYIHVYVAEPSGNGQFTSPKRYFMTDSGLFKSRNEYFNDVNIENSDIGQLLKPEIYKDTDEVFDLRLNETKTYEITFGNGRQGKKPKKGSLIYIFYLASNGPGVDIGIGDINGTLEQDFASFRNSQDGGRSYENIYTKILNVQHTKNADSDKNYFLLTHGVPNVTNISQSLSFAPEETVDEIRDFAPSWFKMGNRLVTKNDYEYYLKNSSYFRNTFADICCQNNWEYMATFYRWLYSMGMKYKTKYPGDYRGSKRFLSQDNLLKTSRQYADPADANNIYIWFYPSITAVNQDTDPATFVSSSFEWKQALLPIKDLTHEPYFIPAIQVAFTICACPDEELVIDWINNSTGAISRKYGENYIEVTISDEILYANASIATQVKNTILNFFRSTNFNLGQYVNFNDLQDQIFAIGGVEKIRTIYKPHLDNYEDCVVRNGVCFASYTTDAILDVNSRHSCLDLEISSAGRSLEAFQFPVLGTMYENINVKIIKHSAITLNSVQY